MGKVAEAIDKALERILPAVEGHEARLLEAMRYATLAGGKRLRPFLVLASGALFEVPTERTTRVACALECIHTYSLVHDDLPCMDDDDLRRGMPTTHRQFDEATAVLAGDALLTYAFEIVADPRTHHDPLVRAELVHAMAREAGAHGMVGGQMIDLLAENQEMDIGGVTRLQQMKTGALIRFAVDAGAIMGRATKEQRHALQNYAHDLGLAFQIVDDLLDVEGSAEEMGKAVGKDEDSGKATFVSLLGVDRARTQAQMLAEQACVHLETFDDKAELLRLLPHFVVNRRH
ncbi:MAG: polyprenyl synthetase family protein [Alphaproteobacteria bacterium]|nr:polyprenyl synthetase family protein [Alphaproteobacteria bacterium]